MNGNSLIYWTSALSRYTIAQLMRWHVIERADKRLEAVAQCRRLFTNLYYLLK